MRSFQRHLSDFAARAIRVVAISVDAPEVNRRHCQRLGLMYTFLSDPTSEVIQRYDLLHPRAGPNRADIARPAEFLIDSTGTVRWAHLTDSITARARPEEVLRAFDDLKLSRSEGR